MMNTRKQLEQIACSMLFTVRGGIIPRADQSNKEYKAELLRNISQAIAKASTGKAIVKLQELKQRVAEVDVD